MAKIKIDLERQTGHVDRRIYGSFLAEKDAETLPCPGLSLRSLR